MSECCYKELKEKIEDIDAHMDAVAGGLDERITELEEELEAVTDSDEDTCRIVAKLADRVEQLETQMGFSCKKLAIHRTAIERLESGSAGKAKVLDTLPGDPLQEIVSKFVLDTVRKERDEANIKARKLEEELVRVRFDYSTKVSNLECEIKELEGEIEELEEKLDIEAIPSPATPCGQERINQLEAEIEELTTELDIRDEEIEDLRDELAVAKYDRDEAQKVADELHTEKFLSSL